MKHYVTPLPSVHHFTVYSDFCCANPVGGGQELQLPVRQLWPCLQPVIIAGCVCSSNLREKAGALPELWAGHLGSTGAEGPGNIDI